MKNRKKYKKIRTESLERDKDTGAIEAGVRGGCHQNDHGSKVRLKVRAGGCLGPQETPRTSGSGESL